MTIKNSLDSAFKKVSENWLADEVELIERLTSYAQFNQNSIDNIHQASRKLVLQVRKNRVDKSGLDAFMSKYDLSSDEGVVLMCLAEALLRVPDKYTADKLIRDKLVIADWKKHVGDSNSLFVNAATWSLMLTGKIIQPNDITSGYLSNIMSNFIKNRSQPLIRSSIIQGMKILGKQYVMGENIAKALKRAVGYEKKGYTYSYDMLGEAAITSLDADIYYKSYENAIISIGEASNGLCERKSPGISIKLSALHPRYETLQGRRVHEELYPKLLKLMLLAKSYCIGLNIDAEESERLELSLELVTRLAHEECLKGWSGFGVVVQAYQKRSMVVLDYLINLAKLVKRRFMIRLVKGAYWDAEIKKSQILGLNGYPVFTRKCYTDVSYIACAKKIFENSELIYPQFATHNAHTVATVIELANGYRDFEFQCLHGMGDALYDGLLQNKSLGLSCRIYAPVGSHDTLLPYLVRRLLENGANSSFVNRIVDEKLSIDDLIADPMQKASSLEFKSHPMIGLPRDLFGGSRINSLGYNLDDKLVLGLLKEKLDNFSFNNIDIKPLIKDIKSEKFKKIPIYNPANQKQLIATISEANGNDVNLAMENAKNGFNSWNILTMSERSQYLYNLADLLEEDMPRFICIAINEAGKTIQNAIDEIREAVDFCRYYGSQAKSQFSASVLLPGPTGEENRLSVQGRGVIVCISPWNFPLAIFLGQIAAAIAVGNSVVAKPAEQTSIMAFEVVKLMYKAGIPQDVVQLVTGSGATLGPLLVNHMNNSGVIFTGSTEVATLINRQLAQRKGAILPLIAETGGQNVMVVDSSALHEQVVGDIIQSSFDSAGQRCSALRVLFIQDDVADHILNMLKGAMKEMNLGNPKLFSTDIGPVIDSKAQGDLLRHIELMKANAKIIYELDIPSECSNGVYISPIAFEIDNIYELKREVFGPILHVVRFKSNDLDDVVKQVNDTGYGLTFGIHSRIQETIDFFIKKVNVGNIYVNRNIVGAVVGVQPFGGHALSGTGPKAGGPLYLQRLIVEKTVSTDTTASGGNASLMTIGD